jgi:uncharacterized protein (DUF1697 family)
MPQFVALLRAINVGGRTVKMERLRDHLTSLGLRDVQTFIASGNVIFDSRARDAAGLERKIESHLLASLGYEVATFVRSAAAVAAVAAHEPFPAAECAAVGTSLYVAFLRAEPQPIAVEQLMRYRTPTDDFHVRGREVYWLCRTKVSESTFTGAVLEKTLKMPATVRNATTVRKLVAKHCPVR